MIKWLENLYATKKWLFWTVAIILSPLLLFWGVEKLSLKNTQEDANNSLDQAKKEDEVMNKEMDQKAVSADDHLTQANKLQQEADTTKVGEDWNKGFIHPEFLANVMFLIALVVILGLAANGRLN